MNSSIIRFVLGYVLKMEAVLMLLPCIVAVLYREQTGFAYLLVAAVSMAFGTLMTIKKPKSHVFYLKEGCVATALSWIFLSFFGALPFWISGEIPSLIDALFETVSGFTTTGSSILADVEALSHCALFWRSFTHWIGGMGVLVFLLAVIPLSGGSHINLMRAESPGPSVGKLVPKIKWIVTIFMILFGVNFNAYYLILFRKFKKALQMEEVRAYFAIIFVATAIITGSLVGGNMQFFDALRHAAFQVGSIITTTGYATVNFDAWSQTCRAILVLLMFVGACAGSTGGGIKVSRFIVMVKTMIKELNSYIHPKSVKKIKMDDKPIEHEVVRSINVYFITFMIIFVASVIAISFEGHDLVTNFTAIAATINNIGPGLSMVGPDCNFGFFSDFSKLVIIFDMLAGRLELFPLLILFHPAIWKELFTQKITMRRKKKF